MLIAELDKILKDSEVKIIPSMKDSFYHNRRTFKALGIVYYIVYSYFSSTITWIINDIEYMFYFTNISIIERDFLDDFDRFFLLENKNSILGYLPIRRKK